jgi:hypothetical protein
VKDLAGYVRLQGEYCGRLGSPFYGALLPRLADDLEAGGPIAAVFAEYPHEPIASAMVLRLMGIVHRRVLTGDAPALARHFPSAGGDGDAAAAWPVFRSLVAADTDALRRAIRDQGVQTNEVGRTAALVGGFLTVARESGLPLRCLEIGASGGLNRRWDHFRYEAGSRAWGPADATVVIPDAVVEGDPPFDVAARVVDRAGCDPHPIDPATDAGRLTLVSYVWPDQTRRLALLGAACDVARRVAAPITRANGADWIAEQLARATPGRATVVYHSIVIQYFDQASRDRFVASIAAAGGRAPRDAPLAWLRMEPGGEQAEVQLTVWPGGESRLVATTGFHGQGVRWLAPHPSVP